MRFCQTALLALCSAGFTAAQEPVSPAPVELLPTLLDALYLPEEDTQGDTLLIATARAAYNMPSAARVQLMEPLLLNMLKLDCDPLHENNAGCNAVFYLAGMPEFYQRLCAENLLPRELALRIPHDEGALLRYMRLRNNQALLSKSAGSHLYLTRRYCTHALERAQRLVQNYLGATSVSRIPAGALSDCLTFMHLASPQAAEGFINSLTLWEHGEHFLEEVPALMLKALAELEWDVAPQALRTALAKLDSMLPGSPDEMIDYDAAQPMGILLTMLMRTEGDLAEPLIRKYAECNEANLAYTAHRIMLQRLSLPVPEKDVFHRLYGNNPETMQPIHRRLYECALVDEALRNNDISALSSGVVERVIAAFRDMGLSKYADIVATLLKNGSLTDDRYSIQAAHHSYIEQPPPSPRIIMARYILAHPEQFPTSSTEQP